MSLFLFHLHEPDVITLDEEGRDLPGLLHAQRYAVEDARSVMREEMRKGRLNLACHIDIHDNAGKNLLAVPFSLAVYIGHLDLNRR